MPTVEIWDGKKYISVPLNAEWIELQAKVNGKIPLIKALRGCANMGLKDAKDAVETCTSNNGNDRVWNVPALINLFLPYIMTPEQKEEAKQAAIRLKEQREAELDKEDTQTILAALECGCNNWKVLGFKNKMASCKAILRNFYKLSDQYA